MDSLWQDFRYGIRVLLGSRGVSLIAVLCLALGIGANTAIFSVVRAVLLESLPYREPQTLVRLNEVGSHGVGSVSGAVYLDLQAERRLFADVAAFAPINRDLGDVNEPERLRGARVTTNLFSTLGARPLVGRTFTSADNPPTAAPVVIISEALLARHFGGNRSTLGIQITLSGTKYTVVGVMPATFDFPVTTARNDFWIPLDLATVGGTTERNNRGLQVVARLAPGIDSSRTAAGLSALAARLAASYPEAHKGRGLLARGVEGVAVGSVRPALLVLAGAVGLVLLIACANVANLTLVRATGRRRELAIRAALGAERGRLVRQLLSESVVLGGAGGLVGVIVAWLGLRSLAVMSASVLPRGDAMSFDAGVVVFAAVIGLLTGVVVGLLPAFRASRHDLRVDLNEAVGRTSGSRSRQRTLKTLIAGEIALSVLLLTGAGLVIRSFLALVRVDPGFATSQVLTFGLAAPARAVPDSLRYAEFYGPILERLRATRGVRGAGMISVLPIQGGMTDRFFDIIGRPIETDIGRRPDAQMRVVGPDYFRTLAIRVLNGRDVTDRDDARSPRVVVVNEELTRLYFPGESAIGKQIEINRGSPMTIVGVVQAVREVGLDREFLPEMYVPAAQTRENTTAMSFVVSTAGDPAAMGREVREVVRGLARGQPLYQFSTMSAVVDASLGTRRLLLTLLSLFSALALVLASAGVYGAMSYGVAQRRREIGIRIALGASSSKVMAMVLREVFAVAGAGLAVGVIVALASARLVGTMLYNVGAHDPVTFLVVPVVIAFVALVAGLIPALRASRVDPLIAMRAD